jgi:tetratricopeptide (TPR) repeat protein
MDRDEAAVEAYRQALQHRQQIAQNLPSQPERQESVARVCSSLGRLLRKAREFEEACAFYDQSIDIRKQLVADHPDNSEYAVNLGGTRCNRGNVARDMDDFEDALVWYGEAIDTLQSVLAVDSANAVAKEFLSKANWGRAQTFHGLGSHSQAVADLESAVAQSPQWYLRMDLARARALAKDHVAATREAMALAITDGPGMALYRIACVFALSASAADSDGSLSQEERNRLTDQYAEQAIQLLREANEIGHFKDEASIQQVETDSDLDPIRSREDFQVFLKELTQESEKEKERANQTSRNSKASDALASDSGPRFDR